MKMRKILTAGAAAFVMAAIGTPAFADHFDGCENDVTVVVDGLATLANELRCWPEGAPNDVNWDRDNPIWIKGGMVLRGCEVHESLAGKLYEERTFDDPDCDEPPRKNCSDRPPKNQNNLVQGASGDLANAKYEAADKKLGSFVEDAYKGKLNEDDFVPILMDEDASFWRLYFVNKVNRARECIAPLLP